MFSLLSGGTLDNGAGSSKQNVQTVYLLGIKHVQTFNNEESGS